VRPRSARSHAATARPTADNRSVRPARAVCAGRAWDTCLTCLTTAAPLLPYSPACRHGQVFHACVEAPAIDSRISSTSTANSGPCVSNRRERELGEPSLCPDQPTMATGASHASRSTVIV
jgi:hypothetical protein